MPYFPAIFRGGYQKYKKIFAAIIWSFLVFLCAFSSGPLVLLTTILPLICGYIINLLRKDGCETGRSLYHTIILIGTSILSIIGYLLYRKINNSQYAAVPYLIYREEVGDKTHNTFSNFLELVNGLPENVQERVPVLSLDGIGYTFRFVMVCFIIISALIFLGKFFGAGRCSDKECLERNLVADYLTILVASEFAIHFLQNYSEPRYYLIEFVPMLILGGMLYCDWTESFRFGAKNLLASIVFIICITIWVSSYKFVNDMTPTLDKYWYCKDLCSYVKKQDVDNVIIVDEVEVATICRFLLPEMKFSNFSSETRTFSSADWYSEINRASYYGDSSIILTRYLFDIEPVFGEDKSSHYEYMGNVYGYQAFMSKDLGVPVDMN